MADRMLADISTPLKKADRAASNGGFPSNPYGPAEEIVAGPGASSL
jgi:hypothetical protein